MQREEQKSSGLAVVEEETRGLEAVFVLERLDGAQEEVLRIDARVEAAKRGMSLGEESGRRSRSHMKPPPWMK